MFCFISKDKLVLISFFLSYKPVLAVKFHLLFSLPDLFPLLRAPVGIAAPRAAQHCWSVPWAGAEQGSSTGSAVSTSQEQLHGTCRGTNTSRESL